MSCTHFWLPSTGILWRAVTCVRCNQRRRVRLRWAHPEPRTNEAALGEAIDRGAIANDEVLWGGQRLR